MYLKDSLPYHRDTCRPVVIAALFTTARNWNQPRWPSTGEWIRKVCYVYTMEYYLAVKKDETMKFSEKWMKLKMIMDEVTLAKKDKRVFSLICGS